MRTLVLVIALALASSATANPLVRKAAIEPPSLSLIQSVRLDCTDAGFGGGSCPSPIEQCKTHCDLGFAEDTLRCMAGAGGILPTQRAICHGKAAGIYAQCLRDCSDMY